MSGLQTLSTWSYEEEEDILKDRTEAIMCLVLSRPEHGVLVPLDESREKAELADRIHDLEARRLQPHTYELLNSLATVRAERLFLLWRLFPIDDLPEEILEHIFLLVIDSCPPSGVSPTRMALIAVCSHWRTIIVNTPKLWSFIPIHTHAPFHLMNLCLQRAKAHPLTLYIDQRDRKWSGMENDHFIPPDDMRSLLIFLASLMDQVRQIFVLADTWMVILAALDVLQAIPAPRILERLEISRSGTPYVEFTAAPPKELSTPYKLFGGAHAPLLNHIRFTGVHMDFASASFRNLRVFEMRKMAVEHMPTLEDFLPVLEGSPRLEVLTFHGASPQLSTIYRGEDWRPISLLYLRELTIGDLLPRYAVYILQLFVAPELRRLQLDKLRNANFTTFVEQLSSQFPKVKVLTVNGLGTRSTGALIAWLRTLPSLLYVKVSNVTDAFLNTFAFRAPEYPVDHTRPEPRWLPVCPRLEVLEIMECSSINMQAVERLQKARLEMQVPLQRVIIPKAEWDTMGEAEQERLDSMGIFKVHPGARPDLLPRYSSD